MALATLAWPGHLGAMEDQAESGFVARIRQCDPDRYFCALFAPAALRDDLLTLYAFNNELARAPEVARDPGLALIRLQWWREIVEGQARRHDVAARLRDLVEAGRVPPALLHAMIGAREQAVEDPPATLAGFIAMMQAGPGALAAATGAVLGATRDEQDALRATGAAYGLSGVLRNLHAEAGRGRCPLPDEVLQAAGLSRENAVGDPDAVLRAAGPAMCAAALHILGGRRRWRRQIVAAALPGIMARRDAARQHVSAARGLGDRLAVLMAAAICLA